MQPLNLEWSKDALEDLDVIWEYITEDSIDNADSFLDFRKDRPLHKPLLSLRNCFVILGNLLNAGNQGNQR